jgi:aryl-phospho-beta-D-glucosidase BglC (GH1 family)
VEVDSLVDGLEDLTFLNVVLKGLKQNTSYGCTACDVCNGNVIMFNPNSFACSIASKVIWLPCPFRINKCRLLKDTPPRTNLLKKDKNSLNMKKVIHVFFTLQYKYLIDLQSLM